MWRAFAKLTTRLGLRSEVLPKLDTCSKADLLCALSESSCDMRTLLALSLAAGAAHALRAPAGAALVPDAADATGPATHADDNRTKPIVP